MGGGSMKPIIIGLCGRAGSGKSSVGRYLRHHYGAQGISFAEPLKRMAMDIWSLTPEQVYGEANVKESIDPRWGISPREMMQRLGQAARDHLYEEIWIHTALDQIKSPGLYVIEDVRYKNEAESISELGYVWRLHCDDSISTDAGTHPSEYEVDQIPKEQV